MTGFDPPHGPESDPSGDGPNRAAQPQADSRGTQPPRAEPLRAHARRGNAPRDASAGASRFQRLRMRRGAPPKDAVLRMEHFHVTAAEKRRREAMERSRGRL